MKICKLCYRALPESQFRGDYCWTCRDMIAQGEEHRSRISVERAEEWLEGWEERKKKLKEEGKI